MTVTTERDPFGQAAPELGRRLRLTGQERATLRSAARIAEKARSLIGDENSDLDTLWAEIQHNARELTEGPIRVF